MTIPRSVVLPVAAVATLAFVALAVGLPADVTLTRLRGWVADRGAVGMLGYGVAYVLLVLALVPGAALTLTGGALFGPVWGVVVVAIATTVADAAAFLLARYVARDAVAALRARYPRFSAFDAALAAGGWRVVALMRLNPAIPYSVSNYLFGASGVAFVPYLVASGLFTLPGAFLYVYLGYIGAETLGGDPRRPREWALLGLGLAVTVATVVYLTRLAGRALRAVDPESR